ncbi:MAG: hypothetical protein K8R56_02005 [Candidatus Eisenbacteria bacterium]|nr:hypothetical protein [Candidatus Eisenbacteria bacterium]
MRKAFRQVIRIGAALVAFVGLVGAGEPVATPPAALPPIVFVARDAASGAAAGQIPGLGPHGTFVVGRGGLFERASDGTVRRLVPERRFVDVADPVVSGNGERVAFAGFDRAVGHWRIYEVARVGTSEPRCLTCGPPGLDPPADDADPCWYGDTLLFVTTRAGGRALYGNAPLTQLAWLAPGDRVRIVSHEANGVLDPSCDAATHEVVFSRWWFNPWRSAAEGGLTRDRSHALTPDSVNQWQMVVAALSRDSRGQPALAAMRLAAGGVIPRRRGSGVQPAPAERGMFAVTTLNMGLSPQPGTTSLQSFARRLVPGQRISGAAIADDAADAYADTRNLRAPGAVSPVVLADGRIIASLDPGGRGDFGLWLVSADGETRERVLDWPGSLELDAAVVPASARAVSTPSTRLAIVRDDTLRTFVYDALDLYGGKGAPPRTSGARLHVYRLVNADSIERIRDVAVPNSGRVLLQLPADTPLFEQLVGPDGRALRSAHGPAQVRGFNSGARGSRATCTGCHLGHTTLGPR